MEIVVHPFTSRSTRDISDLNHSKNSSTTLQSLTATSSVSDSSNINENLFFGESMSQPQDLSKTTESVKHDEQPNLLSITHLSSDRSKQIVSRNTHSSDGILSTKYPSSSGLSDQLNQTSSTNNAVNITRPSLTYPSSSSDNQYQLQPRNGINPLQSNAVDVFSSQFQFPTQQQHSSFNGEPLPHSLSPFTNFQYSQSSSHFVATPTQQLPQLNFPTNSQCSPSYYTNYTSAYSQPTQHDLGYQTRSHSYAENYTSAAQSRRFNWSLDQQPPLDLQQGSQTQKPEQFTQEDIHVLKSLLFNGEKVKWRYVSSKLSAVTGRRATSTACCKKTRELFKLPSDRVTGSLGTSLPYVIHNAWSAIVDDES